MSLDAAEEDPCGDSFIYSLKNRIYSSSRCMHTPWNPCSDSFYLFFDNFYLFINK